MADRSRTNVGTLERMARVLLGLPMAAGGVVLMPRVAMPSTGILAVLLIATAVWLVVTGISGRCPLYGQLRWTEQSDAPKDTLSGQDLNSKAPHQVD